MSDKLDPKRVRLYFDGKPIVGLQMTTAATTTFCATKINIGGGRTLWIDGNAKITAGNGSYEEPAPNAFSLVEIDDCPYSTPTCRKACYVHGLKKHAPDTHELYVHNSVVIRELLDSYDLEAYWRAVNAMSDWIGDNCKGGFRWHVSGDVFSRAYAQFIWRVVALSPNVQHWIYTRSFPFVDELVGLTHFAVNLSADRNNYPEARKTKARYPHTRICYLAKSAIDVPCNLPADSVIFPDYPLRKGTNAAKDLWFVLPKPERRMLCPVDYFGKSKHVRCGPCKKCLRPSPAI